MTSVMAAYWRPTQDAAGRSYSGRRQHPPTEAPSPARPGPG